MDTMKKLTIGDNSGLNRKGERCKVVRCLDGIEVGEVVSIRFKDEFETTPWRLYRLEEKHFPSKYDEDRRRHTGTFVRIPGGDEEGMEISAIKKLEKRLKALRVLETSFPVYSRDGIWRDRKTHYLLTYTPPRLPMAEEEYQLSQSQIQELFGLVNDVLRIAKAKSKEAQ